MTKRWTVSVPPIEWLSQGVGDDNSDDGASVIPALIPTRFMVEIPRVVLAMVSTRVPAMISTRVPTLISSPDDDLYDHLDHDLDDDLDDGLDDERLTETLTMSATRLRQTQMKTRHVKFKGTSFDVPVALPIACSNVISKTLSSVLLVGLVSMSTSLAHAAPSESQASSTASTERAPIYAVSGPTMEARDQSRGQAEAEREGQAAAQIESQAFNVRFSVVPARPSASGSADEAPRYTVVKLSQPPRVVIDVIDADVSAVRGPLEPLKGPVEQFSVQQLRGKTHPIGRLLFTLKRDYEHTVKLKDGELIFSMTLRGQDMVLRSQGPTSSSMVTVKRPSVDTALNSDVNSDIEVVPTLSDMRAREPNVKESLKIDPKVNPKVDPKVELKSTPLSDLKPEWRVTSLDLSHRSSEESESGQDEVQLSLRLAPEDANVKLPTPYLNDDQALTPYLILRGVRMPERLERRLDSRGLNGPLKFVSVMRADPEAPVTQLAAELRHDAAYKVHYLELRDGEVALEWTFTSVSEAYRELAQQNAARTPAFRGGPSDPTPRAPKMTRRKKRYLGKRIKINIKDADIHNVLRFLADCGQVNIVTSDQVEGSVTLMLNQVPWDQALDIILRSKGLDMVREGNIIRVAPREAIAAERKAELKKTEIKEQLKPIMIRLITVNHASGKEMVEQVKGVLSKRGTVNFDARTNTLIIKDIEEHIEASEDLVNRLDTQTPQVLIEARIVEVNKVNEKELGIQWGGKFRGVVGTGNATGLEFPSAVGLLGSADDPQFIPPGMGASPNFMINLPATVGVGSGGAIGLNLGSSSGAFNLNVRLSAAANRGTVKIVSSPKITTLDNKKALISQGVSIPISQVSAQGVQTVFFDATLSLEVTPHVTQDGNIYLTLQAKNDTPDFQNVGSRGDPTILKKQASTQVLLKDGETTVIGGIYTSNAGYGTSEWPILSQIPIIGTFFRKDSERSQRNELLIFITPRVINRLASRVKTR